MTELMEKPLRIYFGDNLPILKGMSDETVDLIYIDPPFNTGRVQQRRWLRTVRDESGDRTGFQGRRYRSICLGEGHFDDRFDDYLAFLQPRLREAHRILKRDGSLFVHLDWHESHYVKVLLDRLFGRDHFLNEIIWAYDYGGRSKRRWPAKHNTILWYARDPARYQFHAEEADRIPYLAPSLVGAEKAARGKFPTDVWWITIVSPTGREKTGYPTQKPRALLDRIVRVHSRPGDLVMDFFAGSGTLGESALALGRRCILVDAHEAALRVMERRFAGQPVEWIGWPPSG
jgi:site-specific DNA-methyltransferase (adenine-specific)